MIRVQLIQCSTSPLSSILGAEGSLDRTPLRVAQGQHAELIRRLMTNSVHPLLQELLAVLMQICEDELSEFDQRGSRLLFK